MWLTETYCSLLYFKLQAGVNFLSILMMVYIKTQAVPSKTACFRHQPRKCIYLKELLQEGSDSCQQLVSCIDILTGSGPAKLKMAYL